MKKIIFAACSVLLCATSCVDGDKDLSTGGEEKVNVGERIVNCEAFEDFQVPVRQGFTTYVTFGEDTLAVANEPMTIRVPKATALTATRAASPEVKVNYDVLDEGKNYSQYWQAVMFEDTENGDYDYNDLVIHVRNVAGKKFMNGSMVPFQTIDVQGIAMGGIKTLKLGCILSDQSEHLIFTDVRAQLFDGTKGFINTEENNPEVWWKGLSDAHHDIEHQLVGSTAGWVAWFIEVDGKRFYAATTDLDYRSYNMVNEESMPYGLVAASTFSFPQEGISIYKAYPDFAAWIKGDKTSIGNPVKGLLYSNDRVVNGEKGKIWNWKTWGKQ